MRRRFAVVFALALLAGTLVLAPSVLGSHAVVGPNVKVTNDNNNVDGGLGNVTPSKDAQNRQANETTVAISPLASYPQSPPTISSQCRKTCTERWTSRARR